MKPRRFTVQADDPRWKKPASLVAAIRRAAEAARTEDKSGRAFTILLTDDARLQALNAQFRGKDKPTNVLSFPASNGSEYLGDIALAYETCAREARAEGKLFAHHAAHLAVHGVLHLLGHDHEKPAEARRMESLEIAILKSLGIADPYVKAA